MSARLDSSIDLHRSGRFADAEAGYRHCLRGGERAAGAPLATLLLQQQRYGEAASLLAQLVDAAPDDAGLAVNLSVALRRSGQADAALRAAQRACALAPESVSAWNARGLAALELDQADEALDAFSSGLALAPGHPALTLHRAHALRRRGRNVDALPLYEQVVQRAPDLLDGWRGLANAQAALGRLDAALRSREHACRLAPNDREVALEHAVAVLQAGDAAAAAALLERLLHGGDADAQAWSWLGRAQIKLGDLPAARAAFAAARRRDAQDPVIAHYHAALNGELPQAVESAYIRNYFDNFADTFDTQLTQNLGYDTPERLARLLRRHGADAAASVLDLGCGTGLMAQALAQPGRAIDGVDLSPRMLDHARAKGLYRALHVAEIGAFLERSAAQWDLIVATDVLIYLPDPVALFAGVARHLADAGWFAFSIETSAGEQIELLPQTARYRQPPQRLVDELHAAGFVDVVREAVTLRREAGQPVAGELLLARKAAPPIAQA
jgi:predicted TPR repeat methyltransferase